MVGNEMIKSESTGSPPKPVTQNAQEWTGEFLTSFLKLTTFSHMLF